MGRTLRRGVFAPLLLALLSTPGQAVADATTRGASPLDSPRPASAQPKDPSALADVSPVTSGRPMRAAGRSIGASGARGSAEAGPVRDWGGLPNGPFLSGRLDLGIFFFRPRISWGYGRPHRTWIGMEVNPLISSEGTGVYGGLRAALPWVDLRVGARYRYTFRRSFLRPQQEYTLEDIELRDGPDSRYVSLEAELTVSFPLGPGKIFSEVAITAVLGVDEGFFVYEETIRIVLDPPWVWRGSLGYFFDLLSQKNLSIGPVVQVVASPRRGRLNMRAGAMVRFKLAHNLQLRGTFVPAFTGPDELGAAGADTFQVGVRYLWAYPYR